MSVQPKSWNRYGLAILSALAGLFVRLPLAKFLSDTVPYMTFMPMVAVSAAYGGLLPGLITTGLSALAAVYFIVPPRNGLQLPNGADALGLVAFLFVGAVISWLNEALLRAKKQVLRLNATLEQRVDERTRQLHAAYEDLEKAGQAKDRFLASMSHELRTPLNAIIGFTGTLLMKLAGPLNDEQTKQLKTVRSSAQHLLSLISDLLDLAKIESGKVALTLAPIVCQSVVEEVHTSLLPLAENKGLALTATVPEGKVVINTDRRALTQILLNLAGNAIKFTDYGEVWIVLARERESGKSWTEIVVRDTGVGIRPEDQANLFQAFTTVRNKTCHREGTGLGLHLSQKLAELLGGQITFKSEYGKGSTFTFSLPDGLENH